MGVLVSRMGRESGGMVSNDRTRAFAQLKYRDPRVVLVDMRRAEATVAASDAPFAVKNLRTRDLRPLRELREACTFCYGMTECTGQKFFVAHADAQDYDAVATWIVGDCQNFAPIQIKEVVPYEVNPLASVQLVVEGLRKYVNSEDLTVAIHLNRIVRGFNPAEIVVPPLKIAALWMFGAIAADQSRWAIWGNFLDEMQAREFHYPS
jgi:hypothetical protein